MKILILTASPQRDFAIDALLAEELTKLGNEVKIFPCLRQGRDAVLAEKPDVVVTPPIRNVYSRDFVNTMKNFGMGVITRHTESSIAWEDYKAIDLKERQDIVGRFGYEVDLEIVWSEDEVGMLRRRQTEFPVRAVGCFVADVYKQEGFETKFMPRDKFDEKHKLDPKKKTILMSSPWGFIDNSPDLRINPHSQCSRDEKGRDEWIKMANVIHKDLGKKFNILLTLHPNIDITPYAEALKDTGLEIDTSSPAVELLKNTDILIHAGSTMCIEMHWLDKPTFQFGDVNHLVGHNWVNRDGAILSRISPHCKTPKDIVRAIKEVKYISNADPKGIEELARGRYGNMDGKASKRAAELINKVKGKFNYIWPDSPHDYTQPLVRRTPSDVIVQSQCGICKKHFITVKLEYLQEMASLIGYKRKKIPPPPESLCPHCGSRFYTNTNTMGGLPK
jgi:surface carbohydrate biosynthesis protein